MKTRARLILLLLFTMLLLQQMMAGAVVKDKSFGARPENGDVRVVWQTVNETDVVRFEIWRAPVSREGVVQEFAPVGTMNPHGVGIQYEFTDASAYKVTANLFAYRLRVVFQDGSYSDSDVVKTSALSSTAKRTWGSIKAMFR